MKYLALLRGINVGGNSKVEMSKLVKVFESLGFKNVFTYINSGNVIFEADNIDISNTVKNIEDSLQNHFGFVIKVVLRDYQNISEINQKIPSDWQNNADQKTDVIFLWDKFCNQKTLDLIKTNPSVDNLKYVSGAIIWNINRADYSQSGMNKFIASVVYKHMTARNVNTVRKLFELMK